MYFLVGSWICRGKLGYYFQPSRILYMRKEKKFFSKECIFSYYIWTPHCVCCVTWWDKCSDFSEILWKLLKMRLADWFISTCWLTGSCCIWQTSFWSVFCRMDGNSFCYSSVGEFGLLIADRDMDQHENVL